MLNCTQFYYYFYFLQANGQGKMIYDDLTYYCAHRLWYTLMF